jgi:amino acid permease
VWEFLSSVLKNLDVIDFRYSDADSKKIDQRDALTVKWRYICSAGLGLLALPVIFQRSLTALRYISMVIVVVMSYTVLLTFVQFPRYYERLHKEPGNHIEWYAKDFHVKWFQGWATMMLSYYSQVLFFFVRGEMMSKTTKRIAKLINALTVALSLFFCGFSCIGYMSLGDKYVPELFTLRREIGSRG